MKKWGKIIFNAIAGMGMVDGLAAIVNPPASRNVRVLDRRPSIAGARTREGAAVAAAWFAVGDAIRDAMARFDAQGSEHVE